MNEHSFDMEVFKALGEALAIGMLVGIERYKGRRSGERESAGVRTFAIFAVMGAVSALVDEVPLTLVTFAALAALLWQGYNRGEGAGMTTELAALLVFWLGYLVRDFELQVISTGIVMTVLLAAKRGLHDFARESVSETEFYDTLKFLVVVFVIFPLLPDRSMGPYEFFNPTQVWTMVVLVSTISYVGYLATRILGHSRGLGVSGIVGGLVSTTAVTMSLATRARGAPTHARICGVVAVSANAVQFPRLLALAWFVDETLGRFLALPLLGMAITGMAGAWVLSKSVRAEEPGVDMPMENPFSLTPALKFGLFFVVIFLFVKLAGAWMGAEGVYIASAVAGLGDASAITLSMADMVKEGAIPIPAAGIAVFIAITMNALVKWVMSLWYGTKELAFWMGGGFVTMLAVGYGLGYVCYQTW